MTSERVGPSTFVLIGDIDGVCRRFPLDRGTYPVGSSPANEIFLRHDGVSRRHALVVVRGQEVQVEDLASKNGTFVNGRRIEHSPLRPGDRIAFGSMDFRLDRIPTADLELAIAFEAPSSSSTGFRSREDSPGDTTSLWSPSPAAPSHRWLEIVDAFLDAGSPSPATPSPATPSLDHALEVLIRVLGAEGACIVRTDPGGEAVILASRGPVVHRLEAEPPGVEGEDGSPRIRVWDANSATEPLLTTVALGTAEGASLALAILGSPPRPGAWDPLLGLLVRLVELCTRTRGAFSRPEQQPPSRSGLSFPPGYVVGESASMQAVYRDLAAVAGSDLPVLLLGETGVGKEEIARILHLSSRRQGEFVALNCAALPKDLLEAELFGIGDRVATGVAARLGRFRQAEGGTLLLDEIGEMPRELQAKLLRALEANEIQPLGCAPRPLDVRLVAATNSRLEASIESGTFRRDLYYRLAGFVLTLPPLRDRREDLPALVEFFLRRASLDAEKATRGMTVAALQQLLDHPWPGNVRELRQVVHRLFLLCPTGEAIDSALVEAVAARPDEVRSPLPARESFDPASMTELRLDAVEKALIAEALSRSEGNKTQAARLLGISREALRRRIARHGL